MIPDAFLSGTEQHSILWDDAERLRHKFNVNEGGAYRAAKHRILIPFGLDKT